jgi:hypothetical protein
MSSDSEGSVTLFFSKLRSGDHEAADELWKRFFPRLRGLARRTLGDCRIGMTDEEDAVQSAFVSFWQRAQPPDQIVTHGLTPPITLRINRPHFLGLKKPEYSYEAYRQTVFPNSAAERFLTGAISVAPRGSNCRVRVRLGDCFETPDEIAAHIGQQIQKIHRVYAV